MNFRPAHSHAEKATINLVPLIDVLLILIIFFIITFAMARIETEVNISVPSSDATKEKLANKHDLVINVRKDGTVVIEQKVYNDEELLAIMQRTDSKQAISIRGDKETSYDNVFKVLNTCQKAGLYHINFSAVQITKDN